MTDYKQFLENLRTQDNRITADPIFVVEQKRELTCEPGCSDDYIWYDHEMLEKADEREARILDRLSERNYGENELGSWQQHCVQYVWEFVTACFTEQGCKDYLAANGHNLNETRIYAYSLYRNQEMIHLRDHLLATANYLEYELKRPNGGVCISSVENCARCGGNHEALFFRPLDNSEEFTHYSYCSATGQPILLKLVEGSES